MGEIEELSIFDLFLGQPVSDPIVAEYRRGDGENRLTGFVGATEREHVRMLVLTSLRGCGFRSGFQPTDRSHGALEMCMRVEQPRPRDSLTPATMRAKDDRFAAQDRANADRDAAMRRASADRAAERVNLLRVEVAAVLAERPTTLDSQRTLFDAMLQHRLDMESQRVSPAERSAKVFDARQLQIEQSDKLEHATIRALLLTTDPDIEAALRIVRAIAHEWNEPMLAAMADNDFERFDAWRGRLANALDDLEAATRKLTVIEAG